MLGPLSNSKLSFAAGIGDAHILGTLVFECAQSFAQSIILVIGRPRGRVFRGAQSISAHGLKRSNIGFARAQPSRLIALFNGEALGLTSPSSGPPGVDSFQTKAVGRRPLNSGVSAHENSLSCSLPSFRVRQLPAHRMDQRSCQARPYSSASIWQADI